MGYGERPNMIARYAAPFLLGIAMAQSSAPTHAVAVNAGGFVDQASSPTGVSQTEPIIRSNIAAVTEDLGHEGELGCEGITIFDVTTGEIIFRTVGHSSPGRLAFDKTGSIAVAAPVNTDRRALQFVRSTDNTNRHWVSGIQTNQNTEYINGTAVAFMPDSQTFLIGTTDNPEGYDRIPPETPKYISLFKTPEITGNGVTDVDFLARVQVEGIPVAFYPQPDGKTAYVITVEQKDTFEAGKFDQRGILKLYTLDITVDGSRSAITHSGPTELGSVDTNYGHTVIYPEMDIQTTETKEGLIIVNGAHEGIIKVVNPQTGKVTDILLGNGIGKVGGVSIHGNRLAVHTGNTIQLYAFDSSLAKTNPQNSITLLSSVSIPEPKLGVLGGPSYSVKLNGRYIIAAADYSASDTFDKAAEFAIFGVEPDGKIIFQGTVTACDSPVNAPNDIALAEPEITIEEPLPTSTEVAVTATDEPTPTTRPQKPTPTSTPLPIEEWIIDFPIALTHS